MEVQRFKKDFILTGPVSAIHQGFKLLLESGVIEDEARSRKNGNVLVCETKFILKPEIPRVIPKGFIITEDMWMTCPIMFWQTRMWWNYYHNTKIMCNRGRTSSYLTLNALKQFKQFKELIVWK